MITFFRRKCINIVNLLPRQIVYLCKHRYANYIIQKLVAKLDVIDRCDFEERIVAYENSLNRHLGARKIVALLKQR